MLLAMILWYAIPVIVVGASLFVWSPSPRRKVVYLSLALVALVVTLVIARVVDREGWGVWLFFVLPAALVTGVRLIVTGVTAESPAD
ncbi:hypothetical protein GCM10009733_019300 [Nonomuraea maheshkhaliensis]|uniref:DUF4175 domain-containing protein n=1 Tax=Nonomuraea maheshkhaliensis TaxID=419590 RepID=A0ABP4QUB3_9ACTN